MTHKSGACGGQRPPQKNVVSVCFGGFAAKTNRNHYLLYRRGYAPPMPVKGDELSVLPHQDAVELRVMHSPQGRGGARKDRFLNGWRSNAIRSDRQKPVRADSADAQKRVPTYKTYPCEGRGGIVAERTIHSKPSPLFLPLLTNQDTMPPFIRSFPSLSQGFPHSLVALCTVNF